MLLNIFIILLYTVREVWLGSQKELAATVWKEHCRKNGLALNDCNWCRCDSTSQFTCTARICSQVDMFGHFNDAIINMDVGMEGHGYWRTTETACEPGIHYQKKDLLCVCNEDGQWPNPVCRDVFQVLHSVVPTKFEDAVNHSCSPMKLYQIGCNVCLCPSTGVTNPKVCTKRDCIEEVSNIKHKSLSNNLGVDEIYADCERGKAYRIGCKTCICLPNNRLLCDNCTSITNISKKVQLKGGQKNKNEINLCSEKTPGKPFTKDCNICYCDKKDVLYCTVLKCLSSDSEKISPPSIEFKTVEAPIDDSDCIPGTEYKKECNKCHCFKFNDVKYFACTMKRCAKQKVSGVVDGCVEGKQYEKNCLICNCVKEQKHLTEYCSFNEKCKTEFKERNDMVDETSLDVLHGYCEPLHTYYKDCNQCKCLTGGKMVACTSKICKSEAMKKPLLVEFIPFIQKRNVCPTGHRYKVDCNFCQCLSNGNAICTTKTCKPALKQG